MFWMIEESVTPQGHYIVLPDKYMTRAAAEEAIARLPSNGRLRAVLYTTGDYHGPERAGEP